MRYRDCLLTALAGLVLSFSTAPFVSAQEPASTGTFRVTIRQDGSWEGFRVAQGHWVWIARRKGVYSGTGPLDGMTSNCVSKGTTAYGISKAEIHCENTDSDGDRIYEVSKEECACAPGGKGGTGSGEFLGGTGKFVGIRGSFRIERAIGARDQAARTWTDHVTIEGDWVLP